MKGKQENLTGKKNYRKYIFLFILAVLVFEGWQLFGDSIMRPFVDNGSSLFD